MVFSGDMKFLETPFGPAKIVPGIDFHPFVVLPVASLSDYFVTLV